MKLYSHVAKEPPRDLRNQRRRQSQLHRLPHPLPRPTQHPPPAHPRQSGSPASDRLRPTSSPAPATPSDVVNCSALGLHDHQPSLHLCLLGKHSLKLPSTIIPGDLKIAPCVSHPLAWLPRFTPDRARLGPACANNHSGAGKNRFVHG